MSKLLAAIVAAMFAVVTAGSFAASHTGGAPMKEGKKDEMKKEMKKDEMKKGAKKEKAKKEMKKDEKKKDAKKEEKKDKK